MSHLNLEMLARLVDEAPTALEAAHLAACEACRDELQALHEQGAALAGLPALQPPPQDWAKLEQRLQEEGLIRSGLGSGPATRRRRGWLVQGGQAAAAVLLFAVGALTGRLAFATDAPAAPAQTATPAVLEARPPESAPRSIPAAVVPEATSPAPDPLPNRRLTASTPEPRAPRTAEEAFDALRLAETGYLDALARFAELSGSVHAEDPAARLAALEGIVLTTRAALAQAPTDPVINGYHLTALAQRDATLRQVSARSTDSW